MISESWYRVTRPLWYFLDERCRLYGPRLSVGAGSPLQAVPRREQVVRAILLCHYRVVYHYCVSCKRLSPLVSRLGSGGCDAQRSQSDKCQFCLVHIN